MVSKEIGLENNSELFTPEIVAALLKDRTTGENIIWATDDYAVYGEEYTFKKQILFEQVTGDFINLIQPRVKKDKDAQTQRSRDKAEVFTPSWVCNAQNNLVDNAWFGKDGKRFNTETPNGWITNYYPIMFIIIRAWKC